MSSKEIYQITYSNKGYWDRFVHDYHINMKVRAKKVGRSKLTTI